MMNARFLRKKKRRFVGRIDVQVMTATFVSDYDGKLACSLCSCLSIFACVLGVRLRYL